MFSYRTRTFSSQTYRCCPSRPHIMSLLSEPPEQKSWLGSQAVDMALSWWPAQVSTCYPDTASSSVMVFSLPVVRICLSSKLQESDWIPPSCTSSISMHLLKPSGPDSQMTTLPSAEALAILLPLVLTTTSQTSLVFSESVWWHRISRARSDQEWSSRRLEVYPVFLWYLQDSTCQLRAWLSKCCRRFGRIITSDGM